MGIETAMSFGGNLAGGGGPAAGAARKQHLHNVQLVRGRHFYGYHPNESLFIKIVL
jgi:hypothetical protein